MLIPSHISLKKFFPVSQTVFTKLTTPSTYEPIICCMPSQIILPASLILSQIIDKSSFNCSQSPVIKSIKSSIGPIITDLINSQTPSAVVLIPSHIPVIVSVKLFQSSTMPSTIIITVGPIVSQIALNTSTADCQIPFKNSTDVLNAEIIPSNKLWKNSVTPLHKSFTVSILDLKIDVISSPSFLKKSIVPFQSSLTVLTAESKISVIPSQTPLKKSTIPSQAFTSQSVKAFHAF